MRQTFHPRKVSRYNKAPYSLIVLNPKLKVVKSLQLNPLLKLIFQLNNKFYFSKYILN